MHVPDCPGDLRTRNASARMTTMARSGFTWARVLAVEWGKAFCVVLLCSAGLFGATSVAQTVVGGERLDPRAAPLANPHFDILAVTVVEMEPGGFTNANPPKGKVRIDEVLRGDDKPGTVTATWRGGETVGDYDPPPQNRGGKYTPGKLKPEWYTRPLEGPKVGDRLIVFKVGEQSGGSFWIQYSYRFSDLDRELVLREMAPPERKDWTQLAAFLAILACPFLSLACFLRLRAPSGAPSRRRMYQAAILLLPLLSLATYGYYESGISLYSNIRTDVLLLWPALALSFALWPALGIMHLLSSRKR